MGPIRIFIGTDESQVVPTAVLRHSITSRTDAAVKFHELTDLKTGLEQDFYTGFSFYRWGIPSFCNYTGSAIYLDTDIVVLCDIRELWDLDMGGHSRLCRPRPAFQLRKFRLNRLGGAYTSVMLLDCARCLDWDFEALCKRAAADPKFYKQVMWCLKGSPTAHGRGALPTVFNDLDHHVPGRTKIIHYTDLPNQPWKKPGDRYEDVFRTALREAYEAGVVQLETVQAVIANGYIHTSVADWCRAG